MTVIEQATPIVSTSAHGLPALEALRDVVAHAKRDDPMAAVTVLVPNNIAGIVARRFLARGLTDTHRGVAGIYVATLPRLAEQLVTSSLGSRRPATRAIQASAWRAALDETPGVFAKVKDHRATVRALVQAHQELRQLSATALRSVAAASSISADLVRLHSAVVTRLSPAWYDTVDVIEAAGAALSGSGAPPDAHGSLVLYLPQDLSRAELRFVQQLSETYDVTVIAGRTGALRADRQVDKSLQTLDPSFKIPPVSPITAGRVLHASDSDDEVRAVVRLVVSRLQTVPAHRIAILYSKASPYARLVQEQLNRADIRFNGPGIRSVHERALAQALLGVLELAEADLPRGDLFRALAAAPTHQFAESFVPVSRWERVSRLAGVVGGSDWPARLSYFVERQQEAIRQERDENIDPVPSRIEALDRLVESATDLLTFVTTLRERFAEAVTMTSWVALAEWAFTLFHDLYGSPESFTRLPADEQYAAVAIESVIQSLAALEEFEPGSASVSAMHDIMESELESALPRVGRFGEGVFVGPLSSAVGLGVDVVYVLGLAEDIYPGRLRQDALLSERVRKLSQGELVTDRHSIDIKERHLLAAFAAAPDVVACFARGDLRRSTRRLPSRWLLPTLRKLGRLPTLQATDWESVTSDRVTSCASFAAELAQTDDLATEQEWRVRAVRAGAPWSDDVVAAATTMSSAKSGSTFTRFDGNLQGQVGLPDFAHDGPRVSPTQLESYAECPHAYFLKRLLRVEPLEDPEEIIQISPMEIGSLIHDSMDALVKEFRGNLPSFGQPWTANQRSRLGEIGAAMGVRYEQRGVTGHPTLWHRESQRIQLDLMAMLDDDNAWRAVRDAEVVQTELAFGLRGEAPVVVPVLGGEIKMRGSADKVDRTRSGTLLVTDIKTGRSAKFSVLEKDPVAAGTKLQLPVYGFAAQQRLGGLDVEAQYWFVRRDRGKRITVELNGALQATYAATLGTLVSSIAAGYFPAKAPEQPDFTWVQCPYCNPDKLGHREVREQWERKRHDAVLGSLIALIDADAVNGGDEPT